MEELAKYLRALLLLELWNAQQTAERTGGAAPKLELLLAESGFATKEIADFLGKTPAAVAKAISRGRLARRNSQANDVSEPEGNSNA
jgi:hypothetical protein